MSLPSTSPSPDPDPATTAGLGGGGGGTLQPGETPPASDSMSGANSGHNSSTGPVSGNRTPMIIALTAIALMTVMMAVFIGAQFVPS